MSVRRHSRVTPTLILNGPNSDMPDSMPDRDRCVQQRYQPQPIGPHLSHSDTTPLVCKTAFNPLPEETS